VKAYDSDPSIRWLFCPTHPDDELGVGAWIKRLTDVGAEVFINWTHHTPVRKSEAEAMAQKLGVPLERLSFMGGEDAHVADQMPELYPRFVELIERVKPDRIVCIAFEQGHLDHDATNCILRHAFDGPVFEWPMYHPYTRRIQTLGRFADPVGEEVLGLTPEERLFKKAMSMGYPSQNFRSILVWYHVLWLLKLRPARLAWTERLRLHCCNDFLTPNLPEPLRSEVVNSELWRRWMAAVSVFKEELGHYRQPS
jgi:LmbE family N-acetylglucosaminyl deacetylase